MNSETKKWVTTTLSRLSLAQMAFNEGCFIEATVGLEPNIVNELRLSVQRSHARTIGEKLPEQDGHSLNWEEIRRLNDALETYYRKLRKKIDSVIAALNDE